MARRINTVSWTLFFLNPFLLFIYSLVNNRASWAPNALWVFIVFFGFTFAIGAESQGSDIVRYIEMNVFFYENVDSIDDAIKIFIITGEIDFIRYVITFLVSRITDSQSVFIATLALIFGFFYSRNVFLLFRQFKGRLSFWTWILAIIFMLVVPFWDINGFRFWTATHVFLYGVLGYLFNNKKQWLWICVLSFIFHFAYLLPIIILLIFHFAPKSIMIALGLFVVTFFYREINIEYINNILSQYAPALFLERTKSYLSPDKIEQFRTGSNTVVWYAALYRSGLNYALSFMLVLFTIKSRAWIYKITNLQLILFFTLILYSAANIVSTIPSGGRFVSLAMQLAVFCIAILYQNYYRASLHKFWLYIVSPAFALFIIVSIRIGFYFISVTTLVGNPVVALFTAGNNLAIIDIIKGFL